MLNLIEKHKFFVVVLFALMTLLLGVSFYANSNQTSNADKYRVWVSVDSLWRNPETGTQGSGYYGSGYLGHGDDIVNAKGFSIMGKVEVKMSLSISGTGYWEDHIIRPSDEVFDDGVWFYAKDEDGVSVSIRLVDEDADFKKTEGKIAVNINAYGLQGFEVYSQTANKTISCSVHANSGEGDEHHAFYVIFSPQWINNCYDPNGGNWDGKTDPKYIESYFLHEYDGGKDCIGDPVREGYTFLGWVSDYTLQKINDGSISADNIDYAYGHFSSSYTGKYFAYWQPNTCTIEFDQNYNDSEKLGPLSVTYDSVLSNVTPPTREGYKFLGYYTATSGGTQIFKSDGSVKTGVSGYTDSSGKWKKDLGANGELTLYAHWKKTSFSITFWNGDEKLVQYDNIYIAEDSRSKALSLPSAASNLLGVGFTFTGFYTEQTGGTEIFKSDGSVKTGVSGYTDANGKLIKEADFNLYAQWREHTYTIKFYKNHNDATGSMASMTRIKYTQQVTLSQNTFARKGYTFSGWAISADGSKVYDDGQTVTSLIKSDGGTKELYAVWSENTYTIKFNSNEGSGTMASQQVKYTGSVTLTKNAFTRKFHLFTEWNTKSDGSGRAYKDETSIPGSVGNMTLYAQWQVTWADRAQIATGDGTMGNPYIIDSKENLAWIAAKNIAHKESFANTYFKQTVNIDLSGGIWLPIGSEDVPFQGKYDGNGYVITSLNTSNVQNASGQYLYSYAGLFGMVGSRSTTTNAEVKNVNIFNSVIYGRNYVGIVAGTVQKAKITSCQTSGSINSSGSHCGGIAGSIGSGNESMVVSRCYSTATINGTSNVGGIVGSLGSGKVISCGFEGSIKNLTGTTNAGILVGNATGGTNSKITDCFANVRFSANFYNGSASISSCLYSATSGAAAIKKYYDGTFENWVVLNGRPLPSGFAWVANATTTAKNTVISDYTKIS